MFKNKLIEIYNKIIGIGGKIFYFPMIVVYMIGCVIYVGKKIRDEKDAKINYELMQDFLLTNAMKHKTYVTHLSFIFWLLILFLITKYL
jgi:hypothetical protein